MYTDIEVQNELNIGVNALKRIRSILRDRGMLVERQRIDDELLELIRAAVAKQRETGCTWEQALQKPVSAAKLAGILHDGTAAERAHELLHARNRAVFGEEADLDGYFDASAAVGDFWQQTGCKEIAAAWHLLEDLFVKAAAFDWAHQQGYINDTPPEA